jgi:hypothetical protein
MLTLAFSGSSGQVQRRFSQRFANQRRRRRRQRRQGEQPRDDGLVAAHQQGTDLAPVQIEVPRRQQRDDQRRGRLGLEQRQLRRPSALSCQPSVAGRASASAGWKSHPCGTAARSAPSVASTSPPCRGPRPKARRPVSKERSAHSRRRIGRSSSLTKRGGLLSARSMVHSSSALSGSRPLCTLPQNRGHRQSSAGDRRAAGGWPRDCDGPSC